MYLRPIVDAFLQHQSMAVDGLFSACLHWAERIAKNGCAVKTEIKDSHRCREAGPVAFHKDSVGDLAFTHVSALLMALTDLVENLLETKPYFLACRAIEMLVGPSLQWICLATCEGGDTFDSRESFSDKQIYV